MSHSRIAFNSAKSSAGNRAFQDFHVFPNMDRRKRFTIGLRDEWLERDHRLNHLLEFCSIVKMVRGSSAGQDGKDSRVD